LFHAFQAVHGPGKKASQTEKYSALLQDGIEDDDADDDEYGWSDVCDGFDV
jgi:hypothetical protein